jgi:hypothetical protein
MITKSSLPGLNEVLDKINYNVVEEEVTEALIGAFNKMKTAIENLPEEKLLFRYQSDKWTIKEIIKHIIEADKYICGCALKISKGEPAETPTAKGPMDPAVNDRTIIDLLDEYKKMTDTNVKMFTEFDDETLVKKGFLWNMEMSIASIGFLTAGHSKHHLSIIEEKYLA